VRAKLSVLRAGRRLLRPGGRLAFFTISVADGLSAADRRRAAAAGPPSPDGPHLSDLLGRAGFTDVDEVDVTADYLTTSRAWLAARLRHRDAVRPVDPQMYDDRLDKGRASIAAIEDGLLRRSLHVARTPS
jgi:cyclopropane fatty-acyl-phospholipid synthase-like methyltransferase